MTDLRMLVVDDDEPMRRGVRELLEMHPGWHVVGEAANGREAVVKAAELEPDVVTLDISMPELDGISAAPLIHQARPQAELIVLSQHDFPAMVSKAVDAGVRGYVLKSRAGRDLVPAVEAASHHASFFSAELAHKHAPAGPGRDHESNDGDGVRV
jgi:DNA-binding NarL/FixJ family response regulator